MKCGSLIFPTLAQAPNLKTRLATFPLPPVSTNKEAISTVLFVPIALGCGFRASEQLRRRILGEVL
jgi:hypothetical protein